MSKVNMSSHPSSHASPWEKTKAKSKTFFDKVGEPVNKVTNKLGAETFWPTSLDKEADKAAHILRSFSLDGFAAWGKEEAEKKKKEGKLDKIPPEVIRNARGLAIFTVMRTGFHWSGAGGSGVVISRLPNGHWSAPSGILIHTLGWGLMAGADIYDCVCVINNEKGMEGFTRVRCTLGGEVSAAVGPLGGGQQFESDLAHPSPVWTYMKSKGLYVGAQVDGTIIVERKSENERFYGQEGVKNTQILAGEVQPPSGTMVQLWETLQAAEGSNHDPSKLPPPGEGAPGDYNLEKPAQNSERDYDNMDHSPEERMDHKARSAMTSAPCYSTSTYQADASLI